MLDIYSVLGVPSTGFTSPPFTTSWALPQYVLAVTRVVFSLYVVTSISYSYAYFAKHKVTFHLQDIGLEPVTFQVGAEGIRQSFSYFTYLSYWSQSFYFFFAALHTFTSAKRGRALLDGWPRYLQAMHSVFYSCVTTFPFLVSSVYWASMYVGPWFEHDFDRWSALSIHGLNSAFAMFEVVMTNSRPQPWAHLGVLMIIMSLYLGIAYITKATENIYIYLWLDPHNGVPQLVAHVVGYAMAVVVIFNASKGAIWLRCQLIDANPNAESPYEFDGSHEHGQAGRVSIGNISRFSSQTSTLKAFNVRHVETEQVDIEKIGEASSVNIPLAHRQSRQSSISSFYDTYSRTSTMTASFNQLCQDRGLSEPARPENVYQQSVSHYRERPRSQHVRNFSRPTSQGTIPRSINGFGM